MSIGDVKLQVLGVELSRQSALDCLSSQKIRHLHYDADLVADRFTVTIRMDWEQGKVIVESPFRCPVVQKLVELFHSIGATEMVIPSVIASEKFAGVMGDFRIWIDPAQAHLHGLKEESLLEAKAHIAGLCLVELPGDVACISNGAGLGMATVDSLTAAGMQAGCFLDLGGGTTPEQVCEALTLVNEQSSIRFVAINVYGGICRCDNISKGILAALERGFSKPLVVRLSGIRATEGREMLQSVLSPSLRLVDSSAELVKQLHELHSPQSTVDSEKEAQ